MDTSLFDYVKARFECRGAIFQLHFTEDAVNLTMVGTSERAIGILNRSLRGNVTIEFSHMLGVSSSEKGGAEGYTLTFHYYTRKKKSGLWRHRSLALRSPDQLMCNHLSILTARRRDDWLKARGVERPGSLLVFVNPYGGRKRARGVYERTVAPVFQLANIKCRVVFTERQNHAREIVENEPLDEYDGVVAVGGDGIANEIVNGLLYAEQRSRKQPLHVSPHQLQAGFTYASPRLKVGVIPAGSTNALVYSMQGNEDAESAAIHIAIGDRHPLDICSIHTHAGQLLKYSFAMTSYGFYGNVLRESEQLRRLGPVRYDLAGFKTFLQLRSHQAEISYLPSDYYHQDVSTDHSACRYPCEVCLKCNSNDEDDGKDESGHGETKGDSPPTPTSLQQSNLQWKVERGKFVVVTSSVMSCACKKSPHGLSPAAHLADGNTDLILVKRCSKIDFFRYLLSHVGKADRFDFPFVDVKRVRAFKYKSISDDVKSSVTASHHKQDAEQKPTSSSSSAPQTSHNSIESIRTASDDASNFNRRRASESCWNTDGEFINQPDICMWVHRGLLQVYARGVEPR